MNNYYISDILSLDTSVTIINTQLIKEIKTNKRGQQLEETLTSKYNKTLLIIIEIMFLEMRVMELQKLLSLTTNTSSG